jgi:tetratricopeptide (TPR) repeat protein
VQHELSSLNQSTSFHLSFPSFTMEFHAAMNAITPRPLARRTPLVLAVLILIAVGGFVIVSRLVTRLRANEKGIARHAYQAGLMEVRAGRPESALDDFRAALVYDADNPEYQLNLARALRETGRLEESEAYLLHLWNAAPQDSTINLALARLAARRGSIDDAIRYYHNAIYGAWTSDPDQNRRKTRFELIDFLLKQRAWPQAQAELLSLAQIMPPDPEQRAKLAGMFAQAGAYSDSLTQYESVLKLNRNDAVALAGAGEAAFQLGHYRTAVRYLEESTKGNPDDGHARERLQMASQVLEMDPFLRRIPDVERNRRITNAFAQAGERLRSCAASKGIELNVGGSANPLPLNTDLPSLWARWQAARPDIRRIGAPSNGDLPDTLMDLIFGIEQQTATVCGEPEGADLALLLISRNREAVDR